MAVPQFGDLVKFGELAWTVYQYGWSPELDATHQYNAFGGDVKDLGTNLDQLGNVISSARAAFRDDHLPPRQDMGWDGATLLDIVGDYNATLNECRELLRMNRRYLSTTGVIKNVSWNALVQPSVDRLRNRIIFHNTKIQLFLVPFKNDVRLRIYQDLKRRIQGVHDEVRGVRQELQALIRAFDPLLAERLRLPHGAAICEVTIPDNVQNELENAFRLHPDWKDRTEDPGVPLHDIADAFIKMKSISTCQFDPQIDSREPSREQYMALLACQFLMTKMLQSAEFRNQSESSHWPSYILELRKDLSLECQRFELHQIDAPLLDGGIQIPTIWPTGEVLPYIASATIPANMEYLFEISLQSDVATRWRKLKLLRYADGTDRHFQILITAGDVDAPARETLPIEVDISTACLVPLYAVDYGTEALKFVLMLGNNIHRLEFLSSEDLGLFQQALTGYEVVDRYMAYGLKVFFVTDPDIILQYASLQLWRPMRLEGQPLITEEWSQRRDPYGGGPEHRRSRSSDGILPQERTPTIIPFPVGTEHTQGSLLEAQIGRGRQGSTTSTPSLPSSRSSVLSASTTVSHASSTRAVTVRGGVNLAGTGTLHCRPTEPLLVFFTRHEITENRATEDRYGIVAVTLDQYTKIDFSMMTNAQTPDVSIERNSGRLNLIVLRLNDDRGTWWNLLPLAQPLSHNRAAAASASTAFRSVIRVTVRFPDVRQRQDFGGIPCDCRKDTEGQLFACLNRGHGGMLGVVRELFRRELADWSSMRYPVHQTHVVKDRGRQNGQR